MSYLGPGADAKGQRRGSLSARGWWPLLLRWWLLGWLLRRLLWWLLRG